MSVLEQRKEGGINTLEDDILEPSVGGFNHSGHVRHLLSRQSNEMSEYESANLVAQDGMIDEGDAKGFTFGTVLDRFL